MRIKILTNSALVDQSKGKWAGLAEEVTVTKERGEYLISVGAAKELKDAGPEADDEAPQSDNGKANGQSTTEQNPATGTQQQKASPVRRAPKTK